MYVRHLLLVSVLYCSISSIGRSTELEFLLIIYTHILGDLTLFHPVCSWVPSKMTSNTLTSATAIPRLLQSLQNPQSGSPCLHLSASPSPGRRARGSPQTQQMQPQSPFTSLKQTPPATHIPCAGVRRPSPPELHPLATFESVRPNTPTAATSTPPPQKRSPPIVPASDNERSTTPKLRADTAMGSKADGDPEKSGGTKRTPSGPTTAQAATMETDLDAPLESPKRTLTAHTSTRPAPVDSGTQTVPSRPELQPLPLRMPLDPGSVFGELDMPLDVPPMSPMSPIPSVSTNPSPVPMITSSIDDYRPSPAHHCPPHTQDMALPFHKELLPTMSSLMQCGGDDRERGLLQQATSRLNGRLISLLSGVPEFGGASVSSGGSALQVGGLQSPSGSGSASGSGISSATASGSGRGGPDSATVGMPIGVGIGSGIGIGPGSGGGSGGGGGGSAGGGSSCTGSSNTCHSGSAVLNNNNNGSGGSGGGSSGCNHHQSVNSVTLSNHSSSNLSTGQQQATLGLGGGTGTILPMPNYGAHDLSDEQHLLPALFQQRICGPAGATAADLGARRYD